MTLNVDKQSKKSRGRTYKNAEHTKHFGNAEQIRSCFRAQDQDELLPNLTALRSQLSLKTDESLISPQDERLLLVQSWLQSAPGAHDIFDLWENAHQQNTITVHLLSIISSVLTLLSSHYTYQSLGHPILKTLLSSQWMRRLNSFIGGSHTELILLSLKLFNSISNFAGGKERKNVMDSFAWELKSLPKLLYMRRKSKSDGDVDMMAKPDIRTLYILFILSFIDPSSTAQVKSAFLDQHRDVLLPISKGLAQDPYSVVRKILEVFWTGLWTDSKIKRTTKIGIFNEMTISQILKVYERNSPEGSEAESIPADLAHHFLLAICTRPGTGICFQDRGWYPRDFDEEKISEENEAPTQRSGQIYNKILANVLKSLKPTDDSRQQELLIKVMIACPELVSGYWNNVSLPLEPRLSSRWIVNISLLGSVVSLPVPSPSFRLTGSVLYHPSPPPLRTILENIFPSVSTKGHLSKGLQSSSALVQHCTALALVKCLIKYEQVLTAFSEVELVLEENEEGGQWSKRRREVEREARRRVPDFQVIVAFAQQKFGGPPDSQPNPTKAALLSESSLRLLWMYHKCLPSIVAEARFDVGKLVQAFTNPEDKGDGEAGSNTDAGLHLIHQLHVMRLLKESDQFAWSSKSASSQNSNLYILLKKYTTTKVAAIRIALADVLRHVLSESILFQEDPEEPPLWLNSLPRSERHPDAKSPDGAPLTDEGDAVIVFLDDCIQRCLKTPYRYLENLNALRLKSEGEQSEQFSFRPNAYPSALLMTVSEQFSAKLNKNLLSPSDALALTAFIRKLTFGLQSKMQNLAFLRYYADEIDGVVKVENLFPKFPILTCAIRREMNALKYSMRHVQDTPRSDGRVAIGELLDQVEQVEPSSPQSIYSAFELVDQLRFLQGELEATDVKRIVSVLERLHKPAVKTFLENLHPAQRLLWPSADIISRFPEISYSLDFGLLFLHASPVELADERCRNVMVDCLFLESVKLANVKGASCRIIHALRDALQRTLIRDLLLLLGLIVTRAYLLLPTQDVVHLKEFMFNECDVIRDLCVSESLADARICQGFGYFLEATLDPEHASDRKLAVQFTAYWRSQVINNSTSQVAPILLWLKYLDSDDLFDLTNSFLENEHMSEVLVAILELLVHSRHSFDPHFETSLCGHLKQLIRLHSILPNSPALEELIARALDAHLPLGYDGDSPTDGIKLRSLTALSDTRWSRHINSSHAELEFSSIMAQEEWTESSVRIVKSLIYEQNLPRAEFCQWLSSEKSRRHRLEHLVSVLHAFLDASPQVTEQECLALEPFFLPVYQNFLEQSSTGNMKTSGSCVYLMVSRSMTKTTDFLASLQEPLQKLPLDCFSSHIVTLGHQLLTIQSANARETLDIILDLGIRWAIEAFTGSGGLAVEMQKSIQRLAAIARQCNAKPHLVDTALTATVQSRLADPLALEFVCALVENSQLKPVTVNRHLQSILQHPQFFKLTSGSEPPPASRFPIVHLLHTLFNLHPTNTCQSTHIAPLVRIYAATMSVSDLQLLSIFQLFESQKRLSIAPLISSWSPSDGMVSSNALESILNLDPVLVLRTCLSFPRVRSFDTEISKYGHQSSDQVYDPSFLLLLFGSMLSTNPPSSAPEWVGIFRSNIVCLIIRCLSSKDQDIREIALCHIACIWKYIDSADMQEKPHVVYLLSILKDLLLAPSQEPPKRLASYTSLILLHALRGIFYPSNFIYPLTARFLLQRPVLDPSDVPLLFGMLYSSSDDWKKERGWIIRFLSDGMLSTEDWRILKRRHSWDLLASLFQSFQNDRTLRNGIFDVLANLTRNRQALTSLAAKSALLAWIEMQLLEEKPNELLQWLKILENILTIADPLKLEISTNGQWRSALCGCLSHLLKVNETTHLQLQAIPLLLRLSLLPGPPILRLPALLTDAVKSVTMLEETITIPPNWSATPRKLGLTETTTLSEQCEISTLYNDPLELWGSSVEMLWRVAMSMPERPSTWDTLTCRVLVWRSLKGEMGSSIGEWARREVLENFLAGVPVS